MENLSTIKISIFLSPKLSWVHGSLHFSAQGLTEIFLIKFISSSIYMQRRFLLLILRSYRCLILLFDYFLLYENFLPLACSHNLLLDFFLWWGCSFWVFFSGSLPSLICHCNVGFCLQSCFFLILRMLLGHSTDSICLSSKWDADCS